MAMYGAKCDGRGTFRYFEPDMNARVAGAPHARARSAQGARQRASSSCTTSRSSISSATKSAGAKRCCAGIIPSAAWSCPIEFIPVAEETGLIVADRRMGAEKGLRRGRDLAGQYHGGGERLIGPVQEAGAGVEGRQRARGIRPFGAPSRDRDHRNRADAGQRSDARHVASAARSWRADRDGRFRHRIFFAELSAELPVRQDQDRPLVHQRHFGYRRCRRHRAGRHQHGRQHEHDDDRRRRREPGNSSRRFAPWAAPKCRAICSAARSALPTSRACSREAPTR